MQQRQKIKLLKALTLIGSFSTGIIYGSIGVIAILSFLKLKQGGADENSFFVLLGSFSIGRILNWILIAGAVCLVIWRFYEAFKDPYGVGNDLKGILQRIGAAFSSAADAFIILSALQAMFNEVKAPVSGEPIRQQHLVAGLLHTSSGHLVVIISGGIILITALVLLFYGLSKGFTERIDATDFSRTQKLVTHGIAYAGYFSRGVILGIVGFFFIKAAVENDSTYVRNTDKAFDFIGDDVGYFWFIAIAIGTICYGLYMFVLGLHYDINGKRKS
ncbi:MAG: DUF1206 domain-containing protein [Candidatus Dadabacteria bacterium]